MIVFDIETAPKEDAVLRKLMPFDPGVRKDVGEFDESTVKLGRTPGAIEKLRKKVHEAREKAGPDPDDKASVQITKMMNELEEKCRSVKEKIEAARQAHEAEVKAAKAKADSAEAEHYASVKGEAALSPVLGTVLVIGYYNTAKDKFMCDDGMLDGEQHPSEAEILKRFWGLYQGCKTSQMTMVGLNIFDFDLPFIMNRSWILKVETPPDVIKNDRYWHSIFVDLRKRWLCGKYGFSGIGNKSSFAWLSKAFHTGGKHDGMSGANFADVWASDKQQALKYLEQDVRQPADWAARMGVV